VERINRKKVKEARSQAKKPRWATCYENARERKLRNPTGGG